MTSLTSSLLLASVEGWIGTAILFAAGWVVMDVLLKIQKNTEKGGDESKKKPEKSLHEIYNADLKDIARDTKNWFRGSGK